MAVKMLASRWKAMFIVAALAASALLLGCNFPQKDSSSSMSWKCAIEKSMRKVRTSFWKTSSSSTCKVLLEDLKPKLDPLVEQLGAVDTFWSVVGEASAEELEKVNETATKDGASSAVSLALDMTKHLLSKKVNALVEDRVKEVLSNDDVSEMTELLGDFSGQELFKLLGKVTTAVESGDQARIYGAVLSAAAVPLASKRLCQNTWCLSEALKPFYQLAKKSSAEAKFAVAAELVLVVFRERPGIAAIFFVIGALVYYLLLKPKGAKPSKEPEPVTIKQEASDAKPPVVPPLPMDTVKNSTETADEENNKDASTDNSEVLPLPGGKGLATGDPQADQRADVVC